MNTKIIGQSPHKIQPLSQAISLPQIAACYPVARTYYYLKCHDIDGSGFVDIHPSQVLEDLGYCRATFYSHLSSQKFFHRTSPLAKRRKCWLKLPNGKFRIFLRSTAKVAISCGMDHIGAAFYITPDDCVSSRRIKQVSAEAAIQYGQNQAQYLLNLAYKGKNSHTVYSIHSALFSCTQRESHTAQTCQPVGRVIDGQKRFFRLHQGQHVPAMSLCSHASHISRSVATLVRYLNADSRRSEGLLPLPRKQVVRTLSDSELFEANKRLFFHEQANDCATYITIPVFKSHTRKFEDRHHMVVAKLQFGDERPNVYEVLPNVYGASMRMAKARHIRCQLKRILCDSHTGSVHCSTLEKNLDNMDPLI